MMWLIGSEFRSQKTEVRKQKSEKKYFNLSSVICHLSSERSFNPLHQERPNLLDWYEWLINFKSPRKPRPLGRGVTGFTLLEVLIVVVIIGSLLMLSLPRFRGTFNNLKFGNFCQDLVSRMQYLKERACVEQNIYRLNFDDLNNKVIKIETKELNSEEFFALKGILGRKINIPDRVEVKIDVPYIFFYPDASIQGKDIKISGEQNKAVIYIKESIGKIILQKENEH